MKDNTVRSRYRAYKAQQWADYEKLEEQRAASPLLKAIFTRNPKPTKKSLIDLTFYAMQERLYANVTLGFADRVRFMADIPLNSHDMKQGAINYRSFLREKTTQKINVLGHSQNDRKYRMLGKSGKLPK